MGQLAAVQLRTTRSLSPLTLTAVIFASIRGRVSSLAFPSYFPSTRGANRIAQTQEARLTKDYLMNQQRRWIAALAVLLCALSVGSAYGVSNGEKVKVNGLITGRNGDTLTIRTLESGNLTVVLTDDTKVEQPKGLLKMRKTEMGVTALMPGLKIQVDGVGDPQSRVVANTIRFSKDDLRQAEAIQAGLAPTQQAVDTNQQNIQANKEGVAANHGRQS